MNAPRDGRYSPWRHLNLLADDFVPWAIAADRTRFAAGMRRRSDVPARHKLGAARPLRYIAAVGAAALVFAGAANVVGARADAAPPLPVGTYCQGPQPTQPATGATHVINLVLENESAITVDQSPDATFENGTLDTQCGTFSQTAMHSTTHPSESNYFALVSGLNGSTSLPADAPAVFGLSNCPPSVTINAPTTTCTHGTGHFAPTVPSLFSLVEQQYGTTGWRTYADGMLTNCAAADGNTYATDSNGQKYNLYVTRHNPAIYFAGTACSSQDIPSGNWQGAQGQLYTDLMSSQLPYYSFVDPSDIENGHDPTTVTGTNGVTTTIAGGTSQIANSDSYLTSFMTMVQQSPQYQDGSLVVMITFDEGVAAGNITGEGAAGEQCADPNISVLATSCQVKTWIVGRYVPNATYSTYMSQFGLLAADQRILGLPPLLGHAGDSATPDIVTGTPANPDPFNLAPTTATAPGVPTATSAAAGNGTAIVSFTPPFSTGGAPITGYTVVASPGGTTTPGTASPIVVSGLTNGTPYTFTVTATNSAGPGSASDPSPSVTPTASPPPPPPPTQLLPDPGFESGNGGWIAFKTGTLTRVTAPVHAGNDALRVASPSSATGLVGLTQNSVISNSVAGRSYTASCYVQPTGANLNAQIRFLEYTQNFGSSITLQSTLVNTLPVGVWTLVRVTSTAVNSGERIIPQIYSTNETTKTGNLIYDDCSVTGVAAAATAPGAPTGITASAGDGKATVSFTAPAANGSPISSYTVTAAPGGHTAVGATGPITVNGLTDGTPYTFTVTATNGVGTGAASSPSNSVTPTAPVVPSAPTGVTATAGNGNATVTFATPTSNGGSPITSYTVTSNPGSLVATGATSPITIAGLTNGTAYTFSVTASNAVGPSVTSSPSNTVTPTAGSPVTELLPDPGFESGNGSWIAFNVGVLTRVTSPVHGGTSALRVGATSTGAALVGLTQNTVVASTVAGKIYTASCFVQPTTANLNVQIRFLEYTHNYSSSLHLQTKLVSALPLNVWTKVQVSSTAVNSGERMVPQIYSSNETTKTGSLVYDDCSVTSN
jgi:hypothetical protein